MQADGQTPWQPLPRRTSSKRWNATTRPASPWCARWGEGFSELHSERLARFDLYPEDATMLLIEPVIFERMNLSWPVIAEGAHDARVALDDWAKLDEFIDKLPDPENDPQMDALVEQATQVRARGQYLMFGWWRLFFERPWAIRGMQNLLMDYYLYPEQVHRLHSALCDLYIAYLDRGVREYCAPDGFGQATTWATRSSLYEPRYLSGADRPITCAWGRLKAHNLHWWLHSCGNNTAILDDLIEAGVDVFHPVQKGTMEYAQVARLWGSAHLSRRLRRATRAAGRIA